MQIPQQLDYQYIRPKGWYSRFKQWPIQPLSSNQYWSPNQIVRFLFTLTNGVMDPYRSHFRMTVAVPETQKVGGLQVDNSAQSFIGQMVVSSNNIERQRITQHDVLAAYLTDIGMSQQICQNRQWQGLGYNSFQTGYANHQYNTPYQSSQFMGTAGNGTLQTFMCYKNSNAMMPTISHNSTYNMIKAWNNNQQFISPSPNFLGPSNMYFTQTSATTADTVVVNALGSGKNIRAQYNPVNLLRDYPDSTVSYLVQPASVAPGIMTAADIRNKTNNGLPYQLIHRSTVSSDHLIGNNTSTSIQSVPNIAGFWGFQKPIAPKFATGCNQPMISSTIKQCQFSYGQVTANPVAIPVRQFSFPCLSSIIGIGIPPDQFCLLPLQVLNNTLVQITLNPYAMFTTGYTDIHQYDSKGMSMQQSRAFKVSQFWYNLHIYQFPDQQIQRYIKQSITKQIAITGSSWQLSAQYQIPVGTAVNGTWQINVAAQYLGQVVVLFVSNQYSKYSFCRKQFRLSNNIRSMQLKFNTDYYPSQPLVGNGGCPLMVDTSGDNTQFMQSLLTAYNYKFITNTPQPRINAYNFAVNSRCYQPSQTGTFYRSDTQFNQTPVLNGTTVNVDTAMGMPWFHENRFVGRAAYVYSFQAHGHSRGAVLGVDARNARPFQIMFNVWTPNAFTADQTMYVFTRANVVNLYGPGGINVLGR